MTTPHADGRAAQRRRRFKQRVGTGMRSGRLVASANGGKKYMYSVMPAPVPTCACRKWAPAPALASPCGPTASPSVFSAAAAASSSSSSPASFSSSGRDAISRESLQDGRQTPHLPTRRARTRPWPPALLTRQALSLPIVAAVGPGSVHDVRACAYSCACACWRACACAYERSGRGVHLRRARQACRVGHQP